MADLSNSPKHGYSLYAEQWGRITHQQLIDLNRADQCLLARAENSDSEGCCVEVARWAFKRNRWERFAFFKFFDGDVEGFTAVDLCHAKVAEINGAPLEEIKLIHLLPCYKPERKPVNSR